MALLEFFRPKRAKTANVAKERLQIIVAERRSAGQKSPAYLPQLKRDILAVLSKHVPLNPEHVSANLGHHGVELSVLELNVTLPDEEK